jgi:OOP family OmpA-OmpF porin
MALRRALTQALLLTLIPLATASAQQLPQQPWGSVRVTHDKTKIECFAKKKAVCMTAPKGTVLEVLYVEGDRYNHRNSNRYWIMLPPDKWGRRVTGWIRGNAIEHVQPPPAPALNASLTKAPETDAKPETPVTAPVEKAPAVRAAIPDVVLHFEFGKSALTDEARRTLESAMVKPTPTSASTVQGVTIELEGHTDWVGSEAYNERLGQARGETVKRYLSERLGFPADRISVVSYGERDPVASNTTKAGRAQNRRVVIKSGGS